MNAAARLTPLSAADVRAAVALGHDLDVPLPALTVRARIPELQALLAA